MKTYLATFAALLIAICCSRVSAEDDLTKLVESALAKAGDNADQLRQALAKAPDDQKEGMRFLVAYMPQRDLTSLSADYLLNNNRLAYQAWNEAPWRDKVSKERFLNDVLPYAMINERRDDWRADFYKRFKPLVAGVDSPGKAAVILNQKIFPLLKVHFSRSRAKADQSPYDRVGKGVLHGAVGVTGRRLPRRRRARSVRRHAAVDQQERQSFVGRSLGRQVAAHRSGRTVGRRA